MHGLIYRRLIPFLFVSFVLNFAIAPPVRAAFVDINTAGLEELDTLPGIGPAIAQKIIDGRPYATVEEISNVQGIGGPGSSTYEKLIGLITVGNGSQGSSSTNQAEQQNTATNQSESTHYSAAPVTKSISSPRVSVSAGRDRVGVVGSPLEFRVDGSRASDRQSMYVWNFGDGVNGQGSLTTHVYEYPGDYVVILSANLPEGEAVARTNVKILESGLSITSASPERIEIKNSSTHEANLFGRALVVGESVFMFPRDTIIKAGKSVSFSHKVTGLRPVGLYETGLIVFGEDRGQKNLISKIEEEKLRQMEKILGEIHNLKEELVARSRAQIQPDVPKAVSKVVREDGLESSQEDPLASLGASAVKSTEEVDSGGWFQTLKRFFFIKK